MTKEDFYILRNSITMRQVAGYYGFRIDRKGFIKCPFHGNGSERTPSLKIFPEFRGFHCKGCGQGGDVTKFVELYENVTQKEAAILLSQRFNIPISDNSEIPEEVLHRAKQAELERQGKLARQIEIQSELRQIATLIKGYEGIRLTAVPFSEIWCYTQNELPKLIGRWEYLFSEMRK
jgi:DNA primase